jgi:hypothetical protein
VQPAVRELVMVTQPCGPALKNQWVMAMSWPHEGPAPPAAPPGHGPDARGAKAAGMAELTADSLIDWLVGDVPLG